MNLDRLIHFMNRPNVYNCGDVSSSSSYFPQFFDIGMCIRHSLDDVRYDYISPSDWIILGGGGIIGNGRDHDKAIERLFQITPNIIVWGAGSHLYGKAKRAEMDYYKRFKLLGVRDFSFTPANTEETLPWLPCVTCMSDEFDKAHTSLREVGVVKHYNHHLTMPDIGGYESIIQCVDINQSIRFIATSESIITNSYHAAYWGTLLGKKVVCEPFADVDKFSHYKYMPTIYSGNLQNDLESAICYSGVLDECRTLNIEFFEKVSTLINSGSMPKQKNYL